MLDPLEPRILFLISTTLDNGLLLIQGTLGNDIIGINLSADAQQVVVGINSVTFMAPVADIKSIRVFAGPGNDRITVAPDIGKPCDLRGGDGNDHIQGPDIKSKLFGENGHDTLLGGAGSDSLVGGGGNDSVSYAGRTDNLVITLDGKANDGLPANGAFKGERDNIWGDVENIIGGSGNDRITGNAGRNTLVGGPGDDTLVGMDGDDLLVGGRGADSIVGGNGDDILMAIDLDSKDSLDGGDGYDSVAYDSVLGVLDTLINTENEVSVLET